MGAGARVVSGCGGPVAHITPGKEMTNTTTTDELISGAAPTRLARHEGPLTMTNRRYLLRIHRRLRLVCAKVCFSVPSPPLGLIGALGAEG